jgi:hypothetical protein
MNDNIEQAIKFAYPTGKLEEPDYSKFDLETTAKNVMDMVNRINSSELLNIEPGIFFRFCPHTLPFAVTLKNDVLFRHWVDELNNKEKIAWIKNSNSPFIVWHITVSLLCPYWHRVRWGEVRTPTFSSTRYSSTTHNLSNRVWFY